MIGFLIALAVEDDLLPVPHAFVDVHFQDLSVPYRLLAIALLAPVAGIDALALTFALGAHRLYVLDHAWPKLVHGHLHARSLASAALFHASLFTTDTWFAQKIVIRCVKMYNYVKIVEIYFLIKFSQNKYYYNSILIKNVVQLRT